MLFNRNNLAVAKFAAKYGVRQEIAGVLFTKEKTCATDSFRLLEVSVDKNAKPKDFPEAMRGFKPFIANAEWVREKLKIPANKISLPVFNNVAVKHIEDNKITFLLPTGNTEMMTMPVLVPRVSGKFPDYEAIFPTEEPVAEIVINGEFLSELLKTMSVFDYMHKVKIKFYSAEKPLVLEANNENQRSRGMIMLIKES